MSATPILLYDGDCAFCSRAVHFVLQHDRRVDGPSVARFAARDGDAGRALLARHPTAASTDSLVWVTGAAGEERALLRSEAVLAICAYLGGGWALLGGAGRLVPRWLRDLVYDLVARHRQRLAGSAAVCTLVSADQRARLLD